MKLHGQSELSVSKRGDALNGMHIGKKIHENGLINLAMNSRQRFNTNNTNLSC